MKSTGDFQLVTQDVGDDCHATRMHRMGMRTVYGLRKGISGWALAGFELERGARRWELPSPDALRRRLAAEPPIVVFVDPSNEFAAAHVPGARWIPRTWLDIRIGEQVDDTAQPIVVIDARGRSAPLAASTLVDLGYTRVAVLHGGMSAWCEAGLPAEQGLAGVMTPPEDVVPTGADRPYHQMINYLRWEEALGHKYLPQRSS